MAVRMSACGVICSECGAYLAGQKADEAYQQSVADAWHSIYKLDVAPEALSCGGCLNVEAPAFATCNECFVRECVLAKGIANCGVCDQYPCAELERVQAQFDGLQKLAETMPEQEFDQFVQPFCGVRSRISAGVRQPWDWA